MGFLPRWYPRSRRFAEITMKVLEAFMSRCDLSVVVVRVKRRCPTGNSLRMEGMSPWFTATCDVPVIAPCKHSPFRFRLLRELHAQAFACIMTRRNLRGAVYCGRQCPAKELRPHSVAVPWSPVPCFLEWNTKLNTPGDESQELGHWRSRVEQG